MLLASQILTDASMYMLIAISVLLLCGGLFFFIAYSVLGIEKGKGEDNASKVRVRKYAITGASIVLAAVSFFMMFAPAVSAYFDGGYINYSGVSVAFGGGINEFEREICIFGASPFLIPYILLLGGIAANVTGLFVRRKRICYIVSTLCFAVSAIMFFFAVNMCLPRGISELSSEKQNDKELIYEYIKEFRGYVNPHVCPYVCALLAAVSAVCSVALYFNEVVVKNEKPVKVKFGSAKFASNINGLCTGEASVKKIILSVLDLAVALIALLLIFAPAVKAYVIGSEVLSFTGANLAFGTGIDVDGNSVCYFHSSANIITYTLLLLGLVITLLSVIKICDGRGYVISAILFAVAGILYFLTVQLSNSCVVSQEYIALGGGSIAGGILSLVAAEISVLLYRATKPKKI